MRHRLSFRSAPPLSPSSGQTILGKRLLSRKDAPPNELARIRMQVDKQTRALETTIKTHAGFEFPQQVGTLVWDDQNETFFIPGAAAAARAPGYSQVASRFGNAKFIPATRSRHRNTFRTIPYPANWRNDSGQGIQYFGPARTG
jgi:hypothetical protein